MKITRKKLRKLIQEMRGRTLDHHYPRDQWPLLSILSHNILGRIIGEYDYYDEDRGEVPYYTMEYVDTADGIIKKTSIKRYQLFDAWRKR